MSSAMKLRMLARASLISLVASVSVAACASPGVSERHYPFIYDCAGDWHAIAREDPALNDDGADAPGGDPGAIGAVRLVRQEAYASRMVLAHQSVYVVLDPHAELSSLAGPVDNLCPPLATRVWPQPLIDWTGHFRRYAGDHHCAQWPRSGDHRSMIYRSDDHIDMHINLTSRPLHDNYFFYGEDEGRRLYALSEEDRALHMLQRDIMFRSASRDSRYAYPVFQDPIADQMQYAGRMMAGDAPERQQILAWLQLQHLPHVMAEAREPVEVSGAIYSEGRSFPAAVVRWPVQHMEEDSDRQDVTLIVGEPRVALARCEPVARVDIRISPSQRRDRIRSVLPR
jgi:hypothetical protein